MEPIPIQWYRYRWPIVLKSLNEIQQNTDNVYDQNSVLNIVHDYFTEITNKLLLI